MWAERVAEWKASGLSSPQFCEGKDFTAGGLRHWAHRLKHGGRPPAKVRVAKVVRLPAAPAATATAELVVEIGAARIVVRPGFDRATLAAVIEALAARAEGSR